MEIAKMILEGEKLFRGAFLDVFLYSKSQLNWVVRMLYWSIIFCQPELPLMHFPG
jgi:hypothetical protein